jgi:hypothetical protein
MSHHSVRLLLRDVSNSLADNIEFKGGRESEFNNLKSKKDHYRWLLPLTATRTYDTTTLTKTWAVAILFMKKDNFDASADQTNEIHDELDLSVDQFMQRLDDWSQTSRDIVGAVTITGVSQVPFYKDQAGVYSGWLVRFNLLTSDDFTYCTPDNERIYAGTY